MAIRNTSQNNLDSDLRQLTDIDIDKDEIFKVSIPLDFETQDLIAEESGKGKTVTAKVNFEDLSVVIESTGKYFRTTNHFLAVYLIVKGFELRDIVFDIQNAPQKGVFLFDSSEDIYLAEGDFFKESSSVSVQDFIKELTRLKYRLENSIHKNGVNKYGRYQNTNGRFSRGNY